MKKLSLCCFLLISGMAVLFANGAAEGSGEGEVTEIRYMTYHVGADPAADLEQTLIDRFNEKFEGTYRLKVEEVPGDHEYTEKLKTLIVSSQMPDVWEGKEPDFDYKAWKAGKAMDLSPILEKDADFAARFVPEAVDVQKRDWEGTVPWFQFREPTEWGYFYNKEIFRNAGLEGPARTWDDFWMHCGKLKEAGYFSVAMQTADNAWLTGHWLMALIAGKGAEGQAFVSTPDPADYEVPVFIESVRELQLMLSEYAQSDVVGADYSLAAASFHGERAAMISNGPWQINSFNDTDTTPAGFADKVGWAVFPGGSYVGGFSRITGGLAVNPERGEKVVAGAVEFLKIMQEDWFAEESFTQLGHRPYGYQLPDEVLAGNPLLGQWANEKKEYGDRAVLVYENILHRQVVDALSNYLPFLVFGEMTAEEFAAKMNEIAAKQ